MCLRDKNFIQLGKCAHGTFHLRLGDTTLHLTERQVLKLHSHLNECVRPGDQSSPKKNTPEEYFKERFNQSMN